MKDREGAEYPDNTISSDKKGEIYFQGLSQGHYVIVETKAPKGYILDTTPHPFDITGQLGKPDKVNLGDFVNEKGSVSLTKKNDHGQVLAGAEFEIQDSKGKTQTVLNEAGKETEKLVSNKDGKVVATGLVPGSYQLVETKAPENYVLNEAKITFTVPTKTQGKPKTITLADVINYQGSVKLQKVSSSNAALSGAVFTLQHDNGKQVGEYTSNKQGQLSVDRLAPGAYYFTEKKAPTGYALSKEKRRFTIASSEKNKPATIDLGKFVNTEAPKAPDVPKSSNKPTTSETASGSYPKTNDTRNPWLLVAGVGIVLIAGILYYRKRKH